MGAAQTALLPPQTAQAAKDDYHVLHRARGSPGRCSTDSLVGKRMVEIIENPRDSSGDVKRPIDQGGCGELSGQVSPAQRKRNRRMRHRMSGGVRGGKGDLPLYSIDRPAIAGTVRPQQVRCRVLYGELPADPGEGARSVNSSMAAGLCLASRSSTRAGPSGLRRPCSQFRTVATLIPNADANCVCESSSWRRMSRTSISSSEVVLAATCSPRRMAPPSRMLSSSSLNVSVLI